MPPHLSAGPTPNTISDFWQMIWDHRPPVIVMLTQIREKGKVSQIVILKELTSIDCRTNIFQ